MVTVPMLQLSGQAARTHARGLLLSSLEKEELLVRIILGRNGRLIAQSQSWSEYWKPVFDFTGPQGWQALDALYQAWSHYIRSGFNSGLRRDFCFRYFSLLDELLQEWDVQPKNESLEKALHCALGFECFTITAAGIPSKAHAAGTTTLRNPCYLLAKLKAPRIPDDCQFLPIITVSGADRGVYFYHYRQHRLSVDSENSLLLYLAVPPTTRPRSFQVVNEFEHLVSEAIDPRGSERANRIARGIIIPYLRVSLIPNSIPKLSKRDFEFVDIGSGSGILAAQLCEDMRCYLKGQGMEPVFRLWMVDLSLAEPSRFFTSRKLSGVTDSIFSVGADYRVWLSTGYRLPHCKGLRIGLISRFFNNLSDFTIMPILPTNMEYLLNPKQTGRDWKACLPSHCLHQERSDPKSLVISNSRLWLDAGRSFAQASLSQFFRGICILSNPSGKLQTLDKENSIFLPVRSFRPESLLADNGASVLVKLLEDCALVIIQDADLRPQDIVDHLNLNSATDIIAVDMTKVLKLKGHFSYALLRSTDPAWKSLGGKKLW
jgi:hypothetical protein